tara:strand:+ start:938 stop:1255 length:318 start_codon:yes stop_codon:yes gene_type:complete
MVDSRTQMAFTKDYLERYMADLVDLVGMHIIMGPTVVGAHGAWDGWAMAESHVAVHVRAGTVRLDCFSCKPFDTGLAAGFMVQRLKLTNAVFQVIERPMPEPLEG